MFKQFRYYSGRRFALQQRFEPADETMDQRIQPPSPIHTDDILETTRTTYSIPTFRRYRVRWNCKAELYGRGSLWNQKEWWNTSKNLFLFTISVSFPYEDHLVFINDCVSFSINLFSWINNFQEAVIFLINRKTGVAYQLQALIEQRLLFWSPNFPCTICSVFPPFSYLVLIDISLLKRSCCWDCLILISPEASFLILLILLSTWQPSHFLSSVSQTLPLKNLWINWD